MVFKDRSNRILHKIDLRSGIDGDLKIDLGHITVANRIFEIKIKINKFWRSTKIWSRNE